MKFASKFTYFNQRKKEEKPNENKLLHKKYQNKLNIDEDELFHTDVNVMSIGFAFLKEAQKNMGTGDAIFCSNCKSTLNSFSKIMTKNEYLEKSKDGKKIQKNEKDEIEEEKKAEGDKLEPIGQILQFFEDIKPNERVWICEFCEQHNKFMIEEEEIPKKNDMIYIIESKNQGKIIKIFFILLKVLH